MPVLAAAVPDPRGNLWVQEYRPLAEDGPETWSIFDAEGRLLGRVDTPEGLTLRQIGEDFVVGTLTDELGIEHVQVRELAR
jgi:hypothetical protein